MDGKERRYRQLMKSSHWRLNNLYKIVTKDSKLITFKENSIQAQINKVSAKRKIYLKARQFGVTTNEVLKLFDYVIFNRNVTACILAHEADAIKKIFRIVKRAYKYLHPMLKPEIDRGGGSKYEMFFPELNSLIYCDLESRGDTINRLHISEAAFMEEERFISTMQAVPIGGQVTLESTANGMENFFYDMWMNENDYLKLFFPWYFHEEYQLPAEKNFQLTPEEKRMKQAVLEKYGQDIKHSQISYRRFKQKELRDKFLQEYPENDVTCFLTSGRSVSDQILIKDLLDRTAEPIEKTETLQIFKAASIKKNYIVGADPAQGLGDDYSVASVLCLEDMEEVAFLRGQFPPFQFARKLDELCKKFARGHKKPLLSVESNNHGHAVLLELIEHLKYPNLYYAKKDRPGWITDSITRPIMVDQCIEAIENEHVKINSKVTLKEMLTLVNKNGKVQAVSGKHDDAFIATAIAIQMALASAHKVKMYEDIGKAIIV
jgi:hypothetical protein